MISTTPLLARPMGGIIAAHPASRRAMHVRPLAAIKKEDDRSSMIDPKAPSNAPVPVPKFSITREALAGRLASIGMFCAVSGEVLTGRGPLGQLSLETGVSEPALLKIIAAIAVANLVLGLLPRSPTYSASNQQRMAERERTASRELQQERGLLWPLSLRNGGLNKRNELVVGRTAMVLFVVALLVDWKVGAGPLVWLNLLPSGVPLKEAPIYFPLLVAPFLLAGIGAGDAQEGNDIDR